MGDQGISYEARDACLTEGPKSKSASVTKPSMKSEVKQTEEHVVEDSKCAPDCHATDEFKVRGTAKDDGDIMVLEKIKNGSEDPPRPEPADYHSFEAFEEKLHEWEDQLKSNKMDELVKTCLSLKEFEEKLQEWVDNHLRPA